MLPIFCGLFCPLSVYMHDSCTSLLWTGLLIVTLMDHNYAMRLRSHQGGGGDNHGKIAQIESRDVCCPKEAHVLFGRQVSRDSVCVFLPIMTCLGCHWNRLATHGRAAIVNHGDSARGDVNEAWMLPQPLVVYTRDACNGVTTSEHSWEAGVERCHLIMGRITRYYPTA